LIGLILSIAGLISAGKKNEKGKGKAVAGIILSSVLIAGVVIFGAIYVARIREYVEDGTIPTVDVDDDLGGSSDDKRVKDITSRDWIEINSASYLTFGRKNSFTYYQSYTDLSDYYYTGTYEIYFGRDAVKELTGTYKDYGVTRSELNDLVDRNDDVELDDLVLLVLKNDGMWIDGENVKDEEWVSPYFGFYYNGSDRVLDLANMNQGTYFTFIPEEDYTSSYPAATSAVIPTDTTDETTWETETTEETTDWTSEETTRISDYEVVGDSLTGTVELTQGKWVDFAEADGGMSEYIEARYQKMNIETGTIFGLLVYKGDYSADIAKELAENSKESMETGDYSNVTMEKTTIGGYEAYTITGKYQDGMYLTVWYFVDSNNKLHYISVEYFGNDIDSYEMVRDTYRFG